jgi:hypothetical protein
MWEELESASDEKNIILMVLFLEFIFSFIEDFLLSLTALFNMIIVNMK